MTSHHQHHFFRYSEDAVAAAGFAILFLCLATKDDELELLPACYVALVFHSI